jgi:hypothetical protein
MLPALERHGAVMRSDSGYWMLDKSNKKKSFKKFIFIQYPGTGISPRRRLYEPEAGIGLILLRQESFKI